MFDELPQELRAAATFQHAVALAAELGLKQQFHRLCQLTGRMFPGEMAVEVVTDPECPQDRFVVFNVTATGELAALLARQREWHEEAFRQAPHALSLFRISIAPRGSA